MGGFAQAAYGPHNTAQVCPSLLADITVPEESTLPSMIALCRAWKEEIELSNRAWVLARAVAAKVVCPPQQEVFGDDEFMTPDPEKILQQQETTYELRWKSEVILGENA